MIRGEARAENEAQVTSLLWEFIRKDGLKGESIEEERCVSSASFWRLPWEAEGP